jgi:hypothetical protein
VIIRRVDLHVQIDVALVLGDQRRDVAQDVGRVFRPVQLERDGGRQP